MPAAPTPPTSSPPNPVSPAQTPPPQHIIRQHGRTVLLLLLAVLAPLLLFADLADDVLKHGGFAWDRTILEWYAARRTPGLTQAAQVLALVAGVGGLPIITLLVAWGLHRARANVHAAFLVLAVAGATLLNVLAKVMFHRPRPDELIAVLREPGFSFPSGHAMANAAFGIALALAFWRSKAGWPLVVFGVLWALLVGASRNYLGVHYPSDVLAGFLASTAWVFGLYLTMGQRWPALRRAPAGEHDTRPPLKRPVIRQPDEE